MDNEDTNVTYMFGRDVANNLEFGLDDTVNIPRGQYEDLLEDSIWLRHLEQAGVEEWEGFTNATDTYEASMQEGLARG